MNHARQDFRSRHLGPLGAERDTMLQEIGHALIESLVTAAVPAGIRLDRGLNLPPAMSELVTASGWGRFLCRSETGVGKLSTRTSDVPAKLSANGGGWGAKEERPADD